MSKETLLFEVKYQPDLSEGKGLTKSGYVEVNASRAHKMFVEDWCYKKFGNRVAFAMGAYTSSAIMDNWVVSRTSDQMVAFYGLEKLAYLQDEVIG